MPVSFYEIKREALIALYTVLHSGTGQVYWYPRQLSSYVDTNASLSIITRAYMSLDEEGLVESSVDPNDLNRLEMFTLSDEGMLRAEELTGNVDPLFGGRVKIGNEEEFVRINPHSEPSLEVINGLLALERDLSVSNQAFDDQPELRDAAIAEVKALQVLWQSGVIRIKAFREKAKASLRWIAEKSANAAIAEVCKRVFNLIVGW